MLPQGYRWYRHDDGADALHCDECGLYTYNLKCTTALGKCNTTNDINIWKCFESNDAEPWNKKIICGMCGFATIDIFIIHHCAKCPECDNSSQTNPPSACPKPCDPMYYDCDPLVRK